MNLKAVMFAGTGLIVSVVATSVWIGNDMAEIRAREEARKQACAATTQPVEVATVPAAATQPAPADCPEPEASADPAIATQDPAMATQQPSAATTAPTGGSQADVVLGSGGDAGAADAGVSSAGAPVLVTN